MAPTNFQPYNREEALAYARQWALSRNPVFYDYSNLGGDCTNFASQVIYAGTGVMNYTPDTGWYYLDPNRKSPSWTGVPFLYNFLTSNLGKGPFAEVAGLQNLEIGDLIQLGFVEKGRFQHSLIVTRIEEPRRLDAIYFATHDQNFFDQKLTFYSWVDIRFLHILGYRA